MDPEFSNVSSREPTFNKIPILTFVGCEELSVITRIPFGRIVIS